METSISLDLKRKRTVLIVDDEQVNQLILQEMLIKNYDLLFASNGQEALKILKSERVNDIALVMMDLVMPEMTGTEVLKEMKKEASLKDLPVIVMTSQRDAEIEALHLGADDFMIKPFSHPEIVLARVKNVIRMHELAQTVAEGLYDSVTGLLTMRHFLVEAGKVKIDAFQTGVQNNHAMIYVNLRNFKLFNSTYGIIEGDKTLKYLANVLKENFPNSLISRFADDHFVVLTTRDHLEENVNDVMSLAKHRDENANYRIKFGIKLLGESDMALTPAIAADQAKLACDFIKNDPEKQVYIYDEKMDYEFHLRNYIIENVDKAIEEGHVKVYFQPVIRSMTGKLCGMEALTRWIDPKYGFLSPGVFIPILENAHLIHKVDRFVVEEVAKRLRYQLDHRLPYVPISYNLSKIDFISGTPFATLEEVVEKYKLHRDMIHCEITESVLLNDRVMVRNEIDRFRDAGYQIWMDDFGSGYSSLNTLKEYRFDELKIDMLFLRNLNEEGKDIISSIVSMAKKLGTHTLAEGAETEEQVEFLKSIGCERIQGYYYSKPEPFEDLMRNLLERGIDIETEQENVIFDQVGLVDLNTDMPVGITMDDGYKFTPLCVNAAYQKTLDIIKTGGLDGMADRLNNPSSNMAEKIRTFVNKTIESGKEESMTYVDDGKYIRLKNKVLAKGNGLYVHQSSLMNITEDENEGKTQLFDSIIRNAVQIFDEIYLWDLDKDEQYIVETMYPWEKAGNKFTNLRDSVYRFAAAIVYEDDRKRFLDFLNVDTIYENVANSKRGFDMSAFRLKQADGSYRMMEILVQVLAKSKTREMLLLVKGTGMATEDSKETFLKSFMKSDLSEKIHKDSKGTVEDAELFRGLLQHSGLCYFWKDTDRRFLGASQAFLDVYGIKDVSDILGKTDEEVGWHIDNNPYQNDEMEVLRHGKIIKGSIGQCIIRGIPHNIAATKFPVYQGGQIVGLMGYFIDTEAIRTDQQQWDVMHYTDMVTGCLNLRGATIAGAGYEESFVKNRVDYVGIMMDVPEYERFARNHDGTIADALAKKIAEAIQGGATLQASIARIREGKFLIYAQMSDILQIKKDLEATGKAIHAIHEVEGYPVTLYMEYNLAWRSEVNSVEDLLSTLILRAEDRKRDNDETVYKEMQVNELLATAMQEKTSDLGIQKMLKRLGESLKADRAFIFEDEGKRVTSCTYEWCKRGIKPYKTVLQHLPAKNTKGLYQAFEKKGVVIIKNIEDIKDIDPTLYQNLKSKGIRSMFAVELRLGRKEVGFIGVHNPALSNMKAAEMTLTTLARLVSLMMKNRDYVRKMEYLAKRDPLTGVLNRRELTSVIKEMDDNTSTAFIYGDLNGLKQLNDEQGHEAGDAAIQKVAEIMMTIAGENSVYRMGGDEFLVVTDMAHQDEADQLMDKLRQTFQREGISVALGCVWKKGTIHDLDELLDEADRRMYHNKKMMYQVQELKGE